MTGGSEAGRRYSSPTPTTPTITRARVLELGELIVRLNIRVAMNHWAEDLRRDWVSADLITTADYYILMVASPRFQDTGTGTLRVVEGAGSRWRTRYCVSWSTTTARPGCRSFCRSCRRDGWSPSLPTILQPRSASHYVFPAITTGCGLQARTVRQVIDHVWSISA